MSANFCTNCGSPVFQGEKFCTSCGKMIADDPIRQQSAPSADNTLYYPAKASARNIIIPTIILVLCLALVIFAALIKFEIRSYIGFAFPPLPAGIIAAIISILSLTMFFKNKKAQIALGNKRSIGGALRIYAITLNLTWIFFIASLIICLSNPRYMEGLKTLNILSLTGIFFLILSIIFGFISKTNSADTLSVIAHLPLLGLSLQSDIIATAVNGYPVLGNYADCQIYIITFILFAVFSAISAILQLTISSKKPALINQETNYYHNNYTN